MSRFMRLDSDSSDSSDGDELPDITIIREAASQGRHLPEDEHLHGLGSTSNATIYGNRHHEDFARSPEVVAACASDIKLARARNARLIMSNEIPDRHGPEAKPYCIWHPQVASETTYRGLALRYPDMRYHVGRACAVAGYTQLYQELDLLPDISIAEEVRDHGAASLQIFEDICGRQIRHAVMDDYTRQVNLDEPRADAYLNGDTAVQSSLDNCPHFDITETGCFNHIASDDYKKPLAEEHVPLLYSPLPTDLPAIADKDILIHMAAYEGNVDRYARLRRPFLISHEMPCIIRGIYHNTTFAK
ncbi:unnamed protein product [Discula destructiva]